MSDTHIKYRVVYLISKNGLLLEYANDQYKNSKHCVMLAVKQNGLALQYANIKLRCDREIVMLAVKQNGLALKHAVGKCDKEIVMAAIRNTGSAIRYVGTDFKTDEDIIVQLLLKPDDIIEGDVISIANSLDDRQAISTRLQKYVLRAADWDYLLCAIIIPQMISIEKSGLKKLNCCKEECRYGQFAREVLLLLFLGKRVLNYRLRMCYHEEEKLRTVVNILQKYSYHNDVVFSYAHTAKQFAVKYKRMRIIVSKDYCMYNISGVTVKYEHLYRAGLNYKMRKCV